MTDEELTRETINGNVNSLVFYLLHSLVDYHSKGTPVWSGDLVNKGSFLANVKLFIFFDGSELPFEMLVVLAILAYCFTWRS